MGPWPHRGSRQTPTLMRHSETLAHGRAMTPGMGRAAVGLLLLGMALGLAGCGAGTHTSKNTRLILGRSIGPISFGETKTKIEADYGRGQKVTLKSGTARAVVVFYPAVSIGVVYGANSQGEAAVAILE